MACDTVQAADRTVWLHSLPCLMTCGPFLAGTAQLLLLYHPSVGPSPTYRITTDCGNEFTVSPKHKEDLWINMSNREDGGMT